MVEDSNYWRKSRPSRRQVIKAGAGLAGLWLAACAPQSNSGSGQTGSSGQSGGGTPKTGGQLLLGFPHPDILNPAVTAVSTNINAMPYFFNGLTKPADDYQSLPDLAESWDISPDSLTYTFKLRKDVKFHDGQPFTAEDVKFTWELLNHPDNVAARQLVTYFSQVKGQREFLGGGAKEIEGIKIVDPYTVQVTLTDIYAPFLSISAGQMIMPKHIWKDVPPKELAAFPASRKPIGTGPFILESWTTNDNIQMRANLEYHAGRPRLDKIVWLYTGDPVAGFNMLKSGQIQVMGQYVSSIPLDNYQDATADPNLEVRTNISLTNMYAEINFRSPVLQDLRVRQAISYATDRKAITQNLYKGLADSINGPIHPSFWAAKPDITTYDGDLNKAKQLFAEAGWKPGPDGILAKDGQKLSLVMPSIQNDANPYDLVLQEQWKKAGIQVEVQRSDFQSFWVPKYFAGKFDIAALNFPFGLYLDPDYPLAGYFSSKLNRNKYNNPKVDELIRSATSTLDRNERKNRYYEFQETLAKDVPHLWIGMPKEIWGIRKGLVIPKKPNGLLAGRAMPEWYWEG